MKSSILLLLTSVLLDGCATPPLEVPSTSPASPAAAECRAPVAAPLLRPDADTRRTTELLQARQEEAARMDAKPMQH